MLADIWGSCYKSKEKGVPVKKPNLRGFLICKQIYGVPVIKAKRRGFLLRNHRYWDSLHVSKYMGVPVIKANIYGGSCYISNIYRVLVI